MTSAADRPGQASPTGVLIVNLGTPTAPTAAAVRVFLAEFLWDPRVIEFPRPLWWLILHGVILRARPGRVAHAYRTIWHADGSPLAVNTGAIAAALAHTLREHAVVELAMRYGQPTIAAALQRLRERGAQRLIVLPVYPQYSGTSTGSVFDAVAAVLMRQRHVQPLSFISDYHDDPAYIDALANSIRQFWSVHGRGERLIMSFHGIPQSYWRAGDPYPDQCRATAQLLAAALALDDQQWELAFQSRFGLQAWMQPYFDERIAALGRASVRNIDVVCPGFAADCLETLEEIAVRGAESFRAAGGGELRYIPALNDSDAHIQALAGIVRRQLAGSAA